MIDFTQIKETCLYVDDLDATQAFYQHKLGLKMISKVEGRHVFFHAGSSVLLCFLPEVTKAETHLPPHFAAGKQHIAFEVELENYESAKTHVQAQGIEITHEELWGEKYKSFYFEDPDGHVLEIVQKGMWG